MRIEKTAQRLIIRGDVSSTAHEIILRQAAEQYFGSLESTFELRLKALTPPGWALITELTLRAVAQTQSATASIGVDLIELRGITPADSDWPAAIDRVAVFLLPGMRLEYNVAEVKTAGTYREMCRKQFDGALRHGKYQFASGSRQLPSNMLATLDALAEIAIDCPEAIITVSGHTDDSGAEPSNLALSQARAESVVAYLVDRGLDPARVSARGMGSAQPISDNADPAARRKNRRIEFEMIFE